MIPNIKQKIKDFLYNTNPRKKGTIIKITAALIMVGLIAAYIGGGGKKEFKDTKALPKAGELDLAFDRTHLEEAWFAKATQKEQEYEKRLKEIENRIRIMPKEIENQREDFKKAYEVSMQRLTDERENILTELDGVKKQIIDGKINPIEGEEKIRALMKQRDDIMRKEQEQAKKEKSLEVKSAYPASPASLAAPTTPGGVPLGAVPPVTPDSSGLPRPNLLADAQREKEKNDPKAKDGNKPSHANLIHMEIDSAKTPTGSTPDGKKKDSAKIIPVESVIPVGSFFRVTLLSGIDAATGLKAQGQPQPVLLKIRDISQLPNKFRQDVRQCHIIGEAYGSLSDERAYIRTSTLSCIKKDNGLVNTKMEGWVAGEDGTVGLRGRVVSRQGAFLARRIVASFLEGVAAAFSTANKRVDTNYFGGVTQTVQPGDAFKMGIGEGAAGAMKDLAKSYEKMSQDISVVIEIASGRKGHVVISSETPLEVKKKLAS